MGCAVSKPNAADSAAPAAVGGSTLLGKEGAGQQGKQVRVRAPEEAGDAARVRTKARKSTPWIKPGDAGAAADEEEEEEQPGKRVIISPESIEHKEQATETICQRAKGRRATPWIKPGDQQPMDGGEDEDEDEDEEGSPGQKRTVVICEDAVRAKEAADEQRGPDGLAEVKRKGQRKSTPFVKLGDAQALEDEDDEDVSEGSPAGQARASSDKHATICPAAVRDLEEAEQSRDAAEEAEAKRTRQRKSTPFCGGGAGLILPDEDEEEEEEDDDSLGPKHVTIIEDDPESSRAATKRKAQRKATPWIKGATTANVLMDEEEDEEEIDDENRVPWFRFLCMGCGTAHAVADRSTEQQM